MRGVECWLYPKSAYKAGGDYRRANVERWDDYLAPYGLQYEPSTGLRAILCAVEFLNPPEIGLIGFDRLLHPDTPTHKWYLPVGQHYWPHDSHAEREAAHGLGVKLIDLAEPYADVP